MHGDDVTETIAKALEIAATWVVLDGYAFDASYQKSLKDAGLSVLFIDDYGQCDSYSSDIILNQNIYASEEIYPSTEAHTKLLLGTKYTMLRQEFISTEPIRKIVDTASKILVTLGGSDPDNVSLTVLEALSAIEELDVQVVIGGVNPNKGTLETYCNDHGMKMVVNTSDMRSLMEWADIAIAGGGSTGYEMCYMGLPSLTIVLAENQRPVAQGLEDAGATLNLGWHTDLSKETISSTLTGLISDKGRRKVMSNTGRTLLDGKGAKRVLSAMLTSLTLRPAMSSDMKILFEWVNDPIVRASAFSQDPIEWEGHETWFDTKLSDDSCYIWIVEDLSGTPVGQIRFDCKEDEAEVDLHLAPDQRGKGYGSKLIALGVQKLFDETSIVSISASVKIENSASAKAFEKSGFIQTASDENVLHFTLQKNG
jgi:UDP-2,4-diacetamido-2,4,6-trideoxy-beta-L-altropyranose hydrolase